MHSMLCVTSVYLQEIINTVFVCVSVGACQKLEHYSFFSDTINVINIKRCMMVLLIELFLFIPLSWTLTIFQGHSSVKQLRCYLPV